MKPDEPRRYLAAERHRLILEHLREHNSAEVSYLSSLLGVSEVTVRKDLEKLELERSIIRSHGGAILNDGLLLEPSFVEKKDRLLNQKEAIAAQAAQLVEDNTTVALSTGTTVGSLAAQLADKSGLTVVTNALNIAAQLTNRDVEIFLTGGSLRSKTLGLVGEIAERSLDGVTCDYLFFGTDGVSLERGLTTPSMEEARVVRALMGSARQIVLLADHSKFSHVGFYRIAPVEQVHTIITDGQTPDHKVNALRDSGIEVIVT
jgi:DeoR/GlpR family transcriptional regulator of sugar metabolism